MIDVFVYCLPDDEQDWSRWEPERLFTFLLSKFPKDKGAATLDVGSRAGKTVLDLFPRAAAVRHDLLWDLHLKAKEERVDADKMKEIINTFCKKQLKEAKAPSEKFKEVVINAIKPSTSFQDLEKRLYKIIDEYERAASEMANRWGMGVYSLDKDPKAGAAKDDSKIRGRESSDTEEPAVKKAKLFCNACGRQGHTAGRKTCVFIFGKHPDVNSDPKVTWADSDNGKKWKGKGHHTLPTYKTLAGGKFDFDKFMKELPKSGNSSTLLNINEANSEEKDILLGGMHSDNNHIMIDILIDTGALQANYINEAAAEWLRSHGQAIVVKPYWCKVCGVGGCLKINSFINFKVSLVNRFTNKLFYITIKAWILPNNKYSLIIGRPTIVENKLLDRILLDDKSYPLLIEGSYKLEADHPSEDVNSILEKFNYCMSLSSSCKRKKGAHINKCCSQHNINPHNTNAIAVHSCVECREVIHHVVEGEGVAVRKRTGNDAVPLTVECRDMPPAGADSTVHYPTYISEYETATHHTISNIHTHSGLSEGGGRDSDSPISVDNITHLGGIYSLAHEIITGEIPAGPIERAQELWGSVQYPKPVPLQGYRAASPALCQPKPHELYAVNMVDIEKIREVKESPYVRVYKDVLLTPIPDEDYIDYDKRPHPWEENNPGWVSPIIYESNIEGETDRVRELILKYKDIFSLKLKKEPAKVAELKLKVNDKEWMTMKNARPTRPQSDVKREEIRQQIDKMLEEGLIRPSQASHWSQILLVPKPNGKWRLCIDYRALNDCTESMGWPIPNIEQLFHRIGQNKPKYFAVLDLTSGFFQAPLHEDSRKYSAFICWMGLFEWCRVSMGLKGAPSWFQQQMADVLAGLLYYICELYLDDLIAYADTFEEYLERLEIIFQRLRERGITVNPEKAKFLMNEVEYLGYLLSKEGIEFSKEKKDKALSFELPKTFKLLKRFMGFAEQFRRHIKDFFKLAQPLHALLRGYNEKKNKSAPITWEDDLKKVFSDMQAAIGNAQRLHFVDDAKEIFLQTDASDYGIGAYLFQLGEDGEQIPIAFISKSLMNQQLNWSVPEKEAFAIFYAFCKLEHLLRDVHFILQTDHKNLTYINYGNSAKILRWKIHVQEFDFSIEYKKGEENETADILSRYVENKAFHFRGFFYKKRALRYNIGGS